MLPDNIVSQSTVPHDDAKMFASTLPNEAFDSNILFGVLAREAELINSRQFADGCAGLLQKTGESLGDILVRTNAMTAHDRDRLQKRVDQYIESHEPAREPDEQADRTLPVGGSIDPSAMPERPDESPRAGGSKDTKTKSRMKLKFMHAQGGIGQVWMARDRVLGRDIALKELRPDRATSEAVRARFLREVQITSQLQHPGTVPVYDYDDGSTDGRSYYTMKFVRGRTLTEVIREYHTRRRAGEAGLGDLIELLNMFDQICDALSYAHSRGILHRDLKGENVITGEYGEVVVIDWGLAKRIGELEDESDSTSSYDMAAADPLQTLHGEAVGTPAFMSPEQAKGEADEYDERTDVYGLAAILYEILTGMPPFVGGDLTSILRAVCETPPNPPRLLNPSLPAELEEVCLKGLSKRPADRQQSAAEIARGVNDWITDQAERSRTEFEREQFFRMSLDALGTLDSNGVFQQVNPAFVEMFGWSVDELKSMTAFDILHPEDTVDPKGVFKRVLEGERITGMVRRCISKDGSVRWVQWHLTKLAGAPLVYVVGRDITHEKHDERFFQDLLNTTPDGMVITDADGTIRIINRPLLRLLGYRSTELIGESIQTLVAESAQAEHARLRASFIADRQARPIGSGINSTARHKDGQELSVEISLMPVESDDRLMVSSTIRPTRES